MPMLRWLIQGLKELIYPKVCLACKNNIKDKDSIEELLCIQCWENIPRNLPPFCRVCGRHINRNNFHKNICPACLRSSFHFDRAFSPCLYDGVIKDLLHEFKYKNKDYLGKILAEPMVKFIEEYDFPINHLDCIIPMPLHSTKIRQREFNQAEILSREISRAFKKEADCNTLIRSRFTRSQTELSSEQRLYNAKNSFKITSKEAIDNKNVLLIDDVLTSGSTASEAALALKNSGAKIVFVLTLAS